MPIVTNCFSFHTHTFNGSLSGITRVSRYQKGKTNLDFNGARDSEWQWHQLGHMQVCTSLQTDNHASTPPLSFLQAGCPSCRPTNSVKALIKSHMRSCMWTWSSVVTLSDTDVETYVFFHHNWWFSAPTLIMGVTKRVTLVLSINVVTGETRQRQLASQLTSAKPTTPLANSDKS